MPLLIRPGISLSFTSGSRRRSRVPHAARFGKVEKPVSLESHSKSRRQVVGVDVQEFPSRS